MSSPLSPTSPNFNRPVSVLAEAEKHQMLPPRKKESFPITGEGVGGLKLDKVERSSRISLSLNKSRSSLKLENSPHPASPKFSLKLEAEPIFSAPSSRASSASDPSPFASSSGSAALSTPERASAPESSPASISSSSSISLLSHQGKKKMNGITLDLSEDSGQFTSLLSHLQKTPPSIQITDHDEDEASSFSPQPASSLTTAQSVFQQVKLTDQAKTLALEPISLEDDIDNPDGFFNDEIFNDGGAARFRCNATGCPALTEKAVEAVTDEIQEECQPSIIVKPKMESIALNSEERQRFLETRAQNRRILQEWNSQRAFDVRGRLLELRGSEDGAFLHIEKGIPSFKELEKSPLGDYVRQMGYELVRPLPLEPGKSGNAALFIIRQPGRNLKIWHSVLKIDKITSLQWFTRDSFGLNHFIMNASRGDACIKAIGPHRRLHSTDHIIGYNFKQKAIQNPPADESLLLASISPLMDGSDLSDVIKEGRLPPAQVKKIMLQIAEGLDHLHSHGVIHRDLNPHNIRIKSNGDVIIFDFGTASKMDQPLISLDTPYQDPAKDVSHWDGWSLGCLGYQMLTGKRLFTSKWQAFDYYQSEKGITFPPGTPSDLREMIQGLVNVQGKKRLTPSEIHTRASALPAPVLASSLRAQPVSIASSLLASLSPQATAQPASMLASSLLASLSSQATAHN